LVAGSWLFLAFSFQLSALSYQLPALPLAAKNRPLFAAFNGLKSPIQYAILTLK
jgi:hypothetical protein